MTFKVYRPDWFFSEVYIPNLDHIKTEFTNLFYQVSKNQIPAGSAFFHCFYENTQYPKSLIDLMNFWKMADDRWCFINFCVLNNGAGFGGIHVDYYLSGADRYIALNIPLINCAKSYNVWYTGEPDPEAVVKSVNYENNVYTSIMNQNDNSDGILSPETRWVTGETSEITRVECTKPMLIHIGRPHQPEVHHNDLRVMLSLRFRPELSAEEFERITQKPNLT